MRMYIANGTRQTIDFSLRLPGMSGPPKSHKIPIGKQLLLPYDLGKPDVDYIIENNSQYGLVEYTEIDRTKPFIGMCYSIDKPVPAPKMFSVMDHNIGVLEQRGRENRQMAAISTTNILENSLSKNRGLGELTGMEMTITEEDNRSRNSGNDLLQETLDVSHSFNKDQHGRVTTGKRNSRRSKDR